MLLSTELLTQTKLKTFNLYIFRTAAISWPLYRLTYFSQHAQLRNGGFCWSIVLLPTCRFLWCMIDNTHIHLTALCLGLSGWAGTRKSKTNLDLTEARDSEWQWHQLGHMQVCISLQTDNHASTPPLSFYRPDALPVAQPTASKHWRK